MQYFIIFGTGETGKKALDYLGYNRVECFCDTYVSNEVRGKITITFDELLEVDRDEYILVIASEKYYEEMQKQVEEAGIDRYFIFREDVIWKQYEFLPFYWLNGRQQFINYASILGLCDFNNYNNIVIVGNNMFLPYLISEISIISDISHIKYIVDIDNSAQKECMGIPIKSEIQLTDDIDCIVINAKRKTVGLQSYLESDKHRIIDIYDVEKKLPYNKHTELTSLRGIYQGKRIFLVGNGPSLTLEDLNTLEKNNEVCIGFNKIYRWFNQTSWRPMYIGMSDPVMIEQIQNDNYACEVPLIIGDRFNQNTRLERNVPNAYYIHLFDEEFWPNQPRFSGDIVDGVYIGGSSVYDIGIQVAAYMGASEIYLLGVDNSLRGNVTDQNNHCIENYYTEDEIIKWGKRVPYTFDKSVLGYQAAEDYSRNSGFRIYNATRGGSLEVFERVNFDELF